VPVDETGDPLGEKLEKGEGGQRTEMNVRYVGKSKHTPLLRA